MDTILVLVSVRGSTSLTCGSMLEVSRDAVAVGVEQLARCTAEQSKYCSIYAVTLDACGDFIFYELGLFVVSSRRR
jgi:hypothetical protein